MPLDLQEATTNAAVVEQAKGLLMGTLGCGVDDAWQLLFSVCAAYRVRVGDLVQRCWWAMPRAPLTGSRNRR